MKKAKPIEEKPAVTQRYGLPLAQWEAMKAELMEILIWHARMKDLPTYSQIADELKTVKFERGSRALADLLTELSASEDAAGHGMISVMVVSKDTGRPGRGFLDQALKLGRKFNVSNPDSCELFWRAELTKVRNHWNDLNL